MADLLEWTLRLAEDREPWRAAWRPVAPGNWNNDVARFFDALKRLDAFFATSRPDDTAIETLFQGPISDVLTHIGQLAMEEAAMVTTFTSIADFQARTGRLV